MFFSSEMIMSRTLTTTINRNQKIPIILVDVYARRHLIGEDLPHEKMRAHFKLGNLSSSAMIECIVFSFETTEAKWVINFSNSPNTLSGSTGTYVHLVKKEGKKALYLFLST